MTAALVDIVPLKGTSEVRISLSPGFDFHLPSLSGSDGGLEVGNDDSEGDCDVKLGRSVL